MKTASIHDAKTNLSKYIAAAKRGEKVTFGYRGIPEVQLVRIQPIVKPKRKFGALKNVLSKKQIEQMLAYDKHKDPEWQEMVEKMYNDDPLADI